DTVANSARNAQHRSSRFRARPNEAAWAARRPTHFAFDCGVQTYKPAEQFSARLDPAPCQKLGRTIARLQQQVRPLLRSDIGHEIGFEFRQTALRELCGVRTGPGLQ